MCNKGFIHTQQQQQQVNAFFHFSFSFFTQIENLIAKKEPKIQPTWASERNPSEIKR